MAQPNTPAEELDISTLQISTTKGPTIPTPPITPELSKLGPTIDERPKAKVSILKITKTSTKTTNIPASQTKLPATKATDVPTEPIVSAAQGKNRKNNKSKANPKTTESAVIPTKPVGPIIIPAAFITSIAESKSKCDTLYPQTAGDLKLIESRYRVKNRKPNPDRAKNVLKDDVPREIQFIGTVKLHGTHADIVINDDNTIRLQSRNRLTLDDKFDNLGFAAAMFPLEKNILKLKDMILTRWKDLNKNQKLKKECPIVIAGEWVGPGIQKKVAVAQLPRRLFAIFSISVNGVWLPDEPYRHIEDPAVDIVHVSRGGFFRAKLNVTNFKEFNEKTMAETLKVVEQCPFSKTFGLEGAGEGIVWKAAYPLGEDWHFWYKTKGPEFAVIKLDQLPKQNPALGEDVVERTRQFAYAVTTEARLEQGWAALLEQVGTRGKKQTKHFTQWVAGDAIAEEQRRIKEYGVELNYLQNCIRWTAEAWYKKRLAEEEKFQGEMQKAVAVGFVRQTSGGFQNGPQNQTSGKMYEVPANGEHQNGFHPQAEYNFEANGGYQTGLQNENGNLEYIAHGVMHHGYQNQAGGHQYEFPNQAYSAGNGVATDGGIQNGTSNHALLGIESNAALDSGHHTQTGVPGNGVWASGGYQGFYTQAVNNFYANSGNQSVGQNQADVSGSQRPPHGGLQSGNQGQSWW